MKATTFDCDAKFANTLGVEICEADLPQALIARNEKYSAEIANGQQFQRLAIHFIQPPLLPVKQPYIYIAKLYIKIFESAPICECLVDDSK